MEILRIPAERVSILLGKYGETRKKIEEKCNIRLQVDPDGEVQMEGDPADIFLSKDVIQAIGRGFPPRIALKLAKDDFNLIIFPLREMLSTEKTITRMKGRVIGEDGKMKTEIESATESYISVYGHTIGLISRIDTIKYAKEAIEMLLSGAPHSIVYGYLRKAKRGIIEERLRS
ncbi:MAG: KH domain-containing protein [Candidatus Micrarchaeota archaeon]